MAIKTKLDLSLNLRMGALSLEEMIKTAANEPNVEVLLLKNSTINDEALEAISKSCQAIRDINLAHCENITSKGLNAVLKNCHSLTQLNLHGCNGVPAELTSQMSAHSGLKRVILSSGRAITINPMLSANGMELSERKSDRKISQVEQDPEPPVIEGERKEKKVADIDGEEQLEEVGCDYNIEPDELHFKETHKPSHGGVWRLVALPNGNVLSASYDHSIGIWDPNTLKNVAFLKGHGREVLDVIPFHGNHFISCSSDGSLIQWQSDGTRGFAIKTRIGMYSLCELHDGTIATGSSQCPPDQTQWSYAIRIWDLKNKKHPIQRLEGHEGAVSSLDVMDDGTLVSASSDHTVKLWNVETGACLQTMKHHKDYVYCVKYLGGNRIASASRDKSIIVFDCDSKRVVKLEGHQSTVYSLVRMPSDLLASASRDGSVTIWNINTGKVVRVLDHGGSFVYSVGLGINGEIIAGLSNGRVVVWKW